VLERYEFKYLVTSRDIPAIRQAALSVGVPDGNASSDGTYTIRSLYFDTYDQLLYQANDRQAHERFKVRVRCYPGHGTPFGRTPVFLEIKRRTGDVIRKSRAALSPSSWVAVVRGDQQALKAVPARVRPAAQAFVEKVLHYHLEPQELVQYQREAFASRIDEYARLTLDTRICSQPALGLSLEGNPHRWRPLDGPRLLDGASRTVLELKFQDRPPRWMVALVKRLDLFRLSFSKYGSAVEASHVLLDRRTANRSSELGGFG
jgi:hypothetical protein